jgi:hypothetical protein
MPPEPIKLVFYYFSISPSIIINYKILQYFLKYCNIFQIKSCTNIFYKKVNQPFSKKVHQHLLRENTESNIFSNHFHQHFSENVDRNF